MKSNASKERIGRIADRLLGIPRELGPRLAYYQGKSGFTDNQLATAASIRVEYLEHIKKGTMDPSYETAERLAKALKVSVAELVR